MWGKLHDWWPTRGRSLRWVLNETGYVEGQNVTVEYHWLEGQYDQMPALMADYRPC
jgi:hypothetical protein